MKRQQYHPHQPSNSWEVSYILSIFRPKLDLGIKPYELFFKIGKERCDQLRNWALTNFDSRWVKEHTLPKRHNIVTT